MNKKRVLILVGGLTLVLIALGWGIKTKLSQQAVPAPAASASPLDRLSTNAAGYFNYLIEGKIVTISQTNPLTIDVAVAINKIFPDYNEADKITSITTSQETLLILRDLKTNTEQEINPDSFQVNDEVVIWLLEPNTNILEASQFTATKIIKIQ